MFIFKDKSGHEWDVTISVATAIRLKNEGHSILALEEQKAKGLRELFEDDLSILEWVWRVVKPQADAKGISQDAFFSALGGNSMGEARRKFLEAYADFTRSPAIRSALTELHKIDRRAEEETQRAMGKVAEFAQKELEKQVGALSDENILRLCNETLKEKQSESNRLSPPPKSSEPSSASAVS